MKYCRNCKMKIENDTANCPLCGGFLEKTDDVFNRDYPNVHQSLLLELIHRSLLFLAIAVSIVSLFVNHYVAAKKPWCIIAIAGVFYLYFSAKFFLKKQRNYGLFILTQVVLCSIVVLAVDFAIGGYRGWSVDYVIPFVIISGSLAISIISIIQPFRFKEHFIYLLIIALLGLIPLILILTGAAGVYWTNAVCVLYSALTVIAMIIFSRRRLNLELKKRLHF